MDCQEVADLVNKKKGSKTETFWPLCHDHERSALLNFKESLVINQAASSYPSAYPKVASWKLDEKNKDCCSWDGVKCNEDTGHVVELDLASSCLYGSINSTSSLFQLVHLQRLSLFDNNFNFSEILNLSRLTHLNLSRSYFSELLELSNSGVLDLSFSDFENFCLGLQKPGLVNLAENLTNLKALNLINVDISSTVPHTLANLSSLRHLSLSGCGLQDLRLSYTRFSGKIPDSMENLQSLSYLDISDCSFIGKIPSSLGNLTKLENLYLSDLSHNQLTGPIPYWLMNLKKVSFLSLRFNQLSGRIPVEISDLTQLQDLQLSSNQLEGSVPSSIFELRNLEALDLSFNNLSGTVDLNMFLLSFKRLEALVLSSNKMSLLTRTTSSTNMQKFKIIGLRSCNLSEFPSFLHNQDQLMSLDLSSNKIAGKIPEWLFSAGTNSLEYLNLSYNLLMDFEHNLRVLPWNSLGSLDLRFNKLQGPFPIPSTSIFSYLIQTIS
ncbi:hypothetical protein CUMW_233930 [Citrus unshiu]|uniref:Leucine-rich repeat-containing N-terminal plant-type domain-containing protein n=1 Tax=Citrus unshiu TaxID=55188 RepID=A0A2H5QIP1_CITUN|nr:hypothetical protein CUMW_233930 [Citrus unshiu]